MATARMTSQNFSPHRGSPSVLPGAHGVSGGYGSWKEIKSELVDCGAYQGDAYAQHPFQCSPHSLPSCMFSSHPVSPSVLHPLPFSERPSHHHHHHHHHFMTGSKENGGGFFREVPPCRRRLDFNHNHNHNHGFGDPSKPVPVAVAKRNERERNRVKLINTTFQTLRQHLPVPSRGSKGKTRKLSKVQTLRSAIEYIRKLEDLIDGKKQERHLQNLGESMSKAKFIRDPDDDEDDDDDGDMDRLPLNATDMADVCASYGTLYKPHVVTSPGGQHPGDFYGADHGISSPESQCPHASSLVLREEPSPLSETSSYEVVAADEDEFLDFDLWF